MLPLEHGEGLPRSTSILTLLAPARPAPPRSLPDSDYGRLPVVDDIAVAASALPSALQQLRLGGLPKLYSWRRPRYPPGMLPRDSSSPLSSATLSPPPLFFGMSHGTPNSPMSSEAREGRSPTSSTVALTNTAEDEESELTEEEEGQDGVDVDVDIEEEEEEGEEGEEKERSDDVTDLDSDEGEDEKETPVQHPRKRCVTLDRMRDKDADGEKGLFVSSPIQ